MYVRASSHTLDIVLSTIAVEELGTRYRDRGNGCLYSREGKAGKQTSCCQNFGEHRGEDDLRMFCELVNDQQM